jgi:hypothetical protein
LDFAESERKEVIEPIRRECESLKIVGTLSYASTALELLLNACDVADGSTKEWRLELLDREFPERDQIFFLVQVLLSNIIYPMLIINSTLPQIIIKSTTLTFFSEFFEIL